MKLIWSDNAWEDYLYWRNADRDVACRYHYSSRR
jgi:Txe/YoeB family toxin of Txe-Axe toxin-antitoxin module